MKNIILISFFLAACAESFQPFPNTIDNWKKENSTKETVQIALFECGYTSITTDYSSPLPSLKLQAQHSECMRDKGFTVLVGGYICDDDYAKKYWFVDKEESKKVVK